MPRLREAFAYGAAADRPAASATIEGQFYFSDDTQDFAQVQEGAWVTVAPSGGVGFVIKRSAFTTDGTYQTVDFPNTSAYTDLWSDDSDPALPPVGWTFNAGRDGLLVPVDGRYLITEVVTWNQHATAWQAVLVSPTGPSASTGVVPPATVLDLSSLGVSATHTQEIKRLAGQSVAFELQTAGGLTSVTVYGFCQYLGPLPS